MKVEGTISESFNLPTKNGQCYLGMDKLTTACPYEALA